MAGERKGKAYETLVMMSLLELKRQGKLKGKVFWNVTPNGMSIEPDFTIGVNANYPDVILLITHSGAAGNSHMKFWRNMGELAEAKTLLPLQPRVYSVAFDSIIKSDLKLLQSASFDGQLIVGDLAYGAHLQKWVDENASKLPKNKNEAVSFIADLLQRSDKPSVVRAFMGNLTADIFTLIQQSRPDLDQLWQMERVRAAGRAPEAKKTFVRRGLSKLLIFEEVDLALRLYTKIHVENKEVPQYIYDLNLARKSIRGAIPNDPEIQNVVELLDADTLKSIVTSTPPPAISAWLLILRNAAHLKHIGEYLVSNYDRLCDPTFLARNLNELRHNPWALVDRKSAPMNWPPHTVWLFDYLMDLFKTASGSPNGYGYAQLAREAAKIPGMPPATNRLYRIVLPDWLHRKGNEILLNTQLHSIALVLSNKLHKLGLKRVETLAEKLPGQLVASIIEAKLVTYRGFDPLYMLISSRIKGRLTQLRSAFADYCGLKGQAAKVPVYSIGSTIIDWQSVSDAGRDHKKKELCGRAVAIRYTWDESKNRFIKRPGLKNLFLVVDGTWRQEDLNSLALAGWDRIFYPDEIEDLVSAIERKGSN